MATILEALKGVNAYPIPLRTLEEVAEGRGLDLQSEVTLSVLRSKEYRLATADLFMWLSFAPNVGQGGQSYSFSEEQRIQLRRKADAIYAECGEEQSLSKPTFGYKGKRL